MNSNSNYFSSETFSTPLPLYHTSHTVFMSNTLLVLSVIKSIVATLCYIRISKVFSHPGCLDFVPSAAAPAFEIWQHLTFLSFHTGLHLAPPLLCYYRCCRDKIITFSYTYTHSLLHSPSISECIWITHSIWLCKRYIHI